MAELRLAFGKSRLRYSKGVGQAEQAAAQQSMTQALSSGPFEGTTLLDIGSGLFSRAAWDMGFSNPQDVLARLSPLGFSVLWEKRVGKKHGCNQFIFIRNN